MENKENERMTHSNPPSSLIKEYASDGIYRVLALDGGGAKGFYTLGVLKEIEAMLGCPLYKRFDQGTPGPSWQGINGQQAARHQ